jgi:hypothetical protein
VQRYTQRASGLVDTSLGDANVTERDEFLRRMASNVGPSFVKYKHGRQLIVASPQYQLVLQQTGMMSGRTMLMSNCILVGLPGISIHSTSTTLAALQDKQMPDYTITMVKLLVKNNATNTRVLSCTMDSTYRITSFQFFFNQVFLPSSFFCYMTAHLLFDLVVKGGKKMYFK